MHEFAPCQKLGTRSLRQTRGYHDPGVPSQRLKKGIGKSFKVVIKESYASSKSIFSNQIFHPVGLSGIVAYLDGILEIPRFILMPKIHRSRDVHEQSVCDRIFVGVGFRPPHLKHSNFSG